MRQRHLAISRKPKHIAIGRMAKISQDTWEWKRGSIQSLWKKPLSNMFFLDFFEETAGQVWFANWSKQQGWRHLTIQYHIITLSSSLTQRKTGKTAIGATRKTCSFQELHQVPPSKNKTFWWGFGVALFVRCLLTPSLWCKHCGGLKNNPHADGYLEAKSNHSSWHVKVFCYSTEVMDSQAIANRFVMRDTCNLLTSRRTDQNSSLSPTSPSTSLINLFIIIIVVIIIIKRWVQYRLNEYMCNCVYLLLTCDENQNVFEPTYIFGVSACTPPFQKAFLRSFYLWHGFFDFGDVEKCPTQDLNAKNSECRRHTPIVDACAMKLFHDGGRVFWSTTRTVLPCLDKSNEQMVWSVDQIALLWCFLHQVLLGLLFTA